MVLKWPFMSCIFPVFFLKIENKKKGKKNVINVVAFDSIKILTSWALQNVCNNLSFVKPIN